LKTILITGNKGLIGNSLVYRLKNNNSVIGYDYNDRFNDIHLEIDLIIHCAAKCVIRDVIKEPSLMMDNVKITFKVLEYARQNNIPIIMLSSNRVTSENSNPYIAGKMFDENLAKAYHDCYGVDYIMIRPETIFGKNENNVRVIRNWIYKAINNYDIIVYGNKDKELSPLSVDTFCDVFMDYYNNFNTYKNTEYTITGNVRKVCDIIDDIKTVCKSNSNVIYLQPEKTQPQRCIEENTLQNYQENFKSKILALYNNI